MTDKHEERHLTDITSRSKMDKATELAHRIIPLADSEWPMTPEGRAIAVEHAATIIRSALADECEQCARVAEDFEAQVRNKITKTVDMQGDFGAIYASKGIAAAIRARGR